MSREIRVVPFLLFGSVVCAVITAVGWSVFAANDVPDGPLPIVWDKAACSTCSMHVGEPGFAAQVVTKDGRCQAFDDPGCLFLYLDERADAPHGIWFHHAHEDRWIAADAVAFVEASPTPMGFGLAAVDKGTQGAMELDVARRRCLQHAGRGEGR